MAVVGALVVTLLVVRPRPTPPPEPSASLAELQRVEGRLVWRSDTNRPFSGWVTENYSEGARKSRSRVVDGRLNGVSEGWNAAGTLLVREHFVEGVSDGVVTKWHPDGTKQSEGTSKAGKFEGLFRRWHTNGILAEEVNLVAGQPHGMSRAWYPSGALKAEARAENGKVLQQRFWKDGEQPAGSLASNAPGKATP